jgi:hypothetical protein
MECPQTVRLRNNYTGASAIHDAAMARLQQRLGICPTSEFLVLSDALDWASVELERTRAALDAHVREHCCIVQDNTATQA